MRLIDADTLLLDNTWEWYDEYGNLTVAGRAVENAPTIDPASLIEKPVYLDAEKVAKIAMERLENNGTIYIDGPMIEYAPAKYGRWDEEWLASPSGSMAGYRVWRCSECQNVSTWQTNYCPNCGAKMNIADIGKDDVG